MSARKITKIIRFSSQDSSGAQTRVLRIGWSDGTTTDHLSEDELTPAERRQLARIEALLANARPENSGWLTRLWPPRAITRRARHSRRRSLDLAWDSNDERLIVSWPTVPGAVPFGFFTLVFCLFAGSAQVFRFVVQGREPGVWLPMLIAATVVGTLLLISAWFMREEFRLDNQSASRTRWPALFKPREAIPRCDVLSAETREYISYTTERRRRNGTLQIRVRRPTGTEWWSIASTRSYATIARLSRIMTEWHVRVNEIRNAD